eukprot:1286424-Prymnesium_polylepis.2
MASSLMASSPIPLITDWPHHHHHHPHHRARAGGDETLLDPTHARRARAARRRARRPAALPHGVGCPPRASGLAGGPPAASAATPSTS